MAGKRKRSTKQCGPCKKRNRPQDNMIIPNFTLPGFNYLGPGGRRVNGPATNAIDEIAKKHDEAYDSIVDKFKESHDKEQSMKEVEKADKIFLQDMVKTRATTAKEAVGKFFGLMGIGFKATVEKSIGKTVYPSFKKIEENSDKDCKKIIRAGDDFN